MKPWTILFITSLIITASAPAQDWAKARLDASPRHLEWVKVKDGLREVNCFVAFPERKDKATAVVVVHEIFGLSDWVRGVTDQLAEAGYLAIAPDLLSGMAPGGGGTAEQGGPDQVRKAIGALPPDQVTADLQAVTEYAGQLPAANGKVVIAGFCWGGGQAFRFATHNGQLKAAFVFYGPGPDQEDAIARITAPVYGFYGGNDARVTATVSASTALMSRAGKIYQPVIYDGAGHGFMRTGEAPDATEPNKKARDAAWQRWKDLLQQL
jgi:carboxymethylenebutenolidase